MNAKSLAILFGTGRVGPPVKNDPTRISMEEVNGMWTKPAYTDMRLGFEINLYVSAR